jgi:hypothetical protein
MAAIGRKGDFSKADATTRDTKLRVKLAGELRLLEANIERLCAA